MSFYGESAMNIIESQSKCSESKLDLMIQVLENDIEFIDQISLTESVSSALRSIWDKIVNLFRKAHQIFSNLILDINYFKSIKMPKQEIDDLSKCLQIMQPRTLRGSKKIIDYYKSIVYSDKDTSIEIKDKKLNRNSGVSMYSMNTTVEFEIDKTMVDIKESINSLEKSDAFKRINENEYNDDNIIDIPLSGIVSDMKDAKNNCYEFEKYLQDITKFEGNINNKYKEINSKVLEYCKLNIKYYQQRIILLNKFFKNAKFSLSWAKVLASKAVITKLSTKRNAMQIKVKISGNKISNIISSLNELQHLSKDNKLAEYKKKHEEVCSLLSIPKESTFACSIESPKENEDIKYSGEKVLFAVYFKKDTNKIPVENKPLYHHSEIDNLSELKPKTIGNWGSTYYPEGRVYVHMNVVLNKAAKKLDIKNDEYTEQEDIDLKTNRTVTTKVKNYMFENRFVYKIKDNIDFVYKDTEMGDTGVFIETDKPIKVEKINYEDWKKENGMK